MRLVGGHGNGRDYAAEHSANRLNLPWFGDGSVGADLYERRGNEWVFIEEVGRQPEEEWFDERLATSLGYIFRN
jgi:hypothetical protein